MATAVLTSKGQITIPKSIRDFLGLKPRDTVVFLPRGEEVLIHPVKGNILDLYGILKDRHKGGPINFKALREKMKEEMAQCVVREMEGKYRTRQRYRK